MYPCRASVLRRGVGLVLQGLNISISQNANPVLLIIYVTTLLVGSMCSDILVGLILTRILYCGWIAPGIQDGDISGLPVLIGSPRA